jgi:hypothetical protein
MSLCQTHSSYSAINIDSMTEAQKDSNSLKLMIQILPFVHVDNCLTCEGNKEINCLGKNDRCQMLTKYLITHQFKIPLVCV